MSSEFFCKFCEITCTGTAPYEQHLKSVKHLKKAKLNESFPSSDPPISTNIHSSSPTTYTHTPIFTTNDHIIEDSSNSSVSFSISPETMRILLEWNHPYGYKPYCDICQLPLHGENNADIHFMSNNNLHNQKLAAWKQIQEKDARFSCAVCYQIFSSENIMRDHFTSDAHAAVVQEKNNLKKFIDIYQTYQKLKQARMQRKDLEASDEAEGNLANQFEKLKVIDVTESKTTPAKPGIFSQDKLAAALMKNVSDDDC